MLTVTYAPDLAAASVLVAVMASFTALRLTSGLSVLSSRARKVRVSQAAFALGGGIWSMHFIGMLAVEISTAIFYDPLRTLGSILIAVLITGSAFMSLHFGQRTPARIALAGAITGAGIVSMHYVGMSAISGCIVTYDAKGVLLAAGVAAAASILAMHLAYKTRSLARTIGGGIVLGLSISAMHYTAMLFTAFSLGENAVFQASPAISSDNLALLVALAAFLICGLFLLLAVPADTAQKSAAAAAAGGGGESGSANGAESAVPAGRAKVVAFSRAGAVVGQSSKPNTPPDVKQAAGPVRIPYERDKTLRFIAAQTIHFAQADGHYTKIVNDNDTFFCPWPISRLEKRLENEQFMRVHRSYLINTRHIKGFRRDGDKGVCIVGGLKEAEVPVSRSYVARLQELFSA